MWCLLTGHMLLTEACTETQIAIGSHTQLLSTENVTDYTLMINVKINPFTYKYWEFFSVFDNFLKIQKKYRNLAGEDFLSISSVTVYY